MKRKSLLSILFVGMLLMLASCAPKEPTGTLTLGKSEFAPNEQIKLTFTTTGTYGNHPWIGIIPSNIPHGDESKNDEHDLTYQYFDGMASGELVFNAPAEGGNYDFRMHTTDETGVEVASISFKVIAVKVDVTISLNKNEFAPGEEILVNFTAPAEFPDNAWIGIIPSETPHGSEAKNDEVDIAYKHLSKQTSGQITFKAPSKPGSYDARMNDSDSNGKEVASVTFSVK